MKLGLEHREQVYFLAGLIVLAGYMMYVNWMPGHRASAPRPLPAHPSAPRPGAKAVGQAIVLRRLSISWLSLPFPGGAK